ncbi:ATP-dependent helicase [Psychroserpens sp.]|uniref:ATP-dependent helicase n=1 Tax=Psychroserpens sp. TaxID=2020870 RepID=UPI001B0C21CF|nr:UvrD-helicase domain-containing protein [Psychroserpens sp.]MBO6607454.1 UvrD-helicase domain-containing protein [Psychroserpens sp.]MBO6654468.1 UvrD-helicase domain-containing protein [Psychroserpens sp.]MBO6681183.1 UvrD-helicase domain-containing protein [Psychroserpens sp.]MBO6749860.1 UvrD-helicase domain-containing protein [Psychroserpens sp.]MBO6916152.1 UvrD-helicase domain-containing protein [Psychroserpens sp.]
MERYLSQLNDAQLAPVLQKDGPMIVIAGAGSGKTRVLTYRIAYLMSQGVDPFNILALTFTNKAAREMKGRIADIVGTSEAKNLWMGTFHSVFAKILRFEADRLGFPSNFTIYDTQDSDRLISSIIKEMGLDKDVYKYKQIRSRISSYKNSLITVKAYFQNPELIEADTAARRPRLGDIYKNYVDRCFKAGAMDFDDLLLKTNELLTRFPDVLAKYQDRFRYILVDEYQDTNHSQYLIVRALSDRFQNICVVGDDAQSIYAFRGANINNILNFQRDYDDVNVYRLEQNYRSTKNIVNAANSIIDKNQTKLDKIVWTANEEGPKIKVNRLMTDGDEGRFVASSIFENKMQHQLKDSDFAVLYRTNAQSRSIEDALRKRDIPYRIYGGLSFYQRKEIKDVLSYLRLIINPSDEEALKRIINFPARGIGQTTVDKLVVAANGYNRSIFEVMKQIDKTEVNVNAGTRNKLKDFVTMIESFQVMNKTANAFELAEHVTKASGIIRAYNKESTPEDITRLENIEELLNGIKDFVEGQKELADATGNIAEFLEDVALATDLDNDKGDDERVALMTIHLAKGLEFPYVYIVGMEEDLFPSAMSMNTRSELEEERRLFYVALTRAEKQAYLTYTLSRYRWGKLIDAEPSRFIEEIDDQYLDVITPLHEPRQNPMLSADIFGDVEPNRIRFKKPVKRKSETKAPKFVAPKNLKPISKTKASQSVNLFDGQLAVGNIVEHTRFGKGEVLKIEGKGPDMKAEINFEVGGVKKLLLKFAKLDILS